MIVRDIAELRHLTRRRRSFTRRNEDVVQLMIPGIMDSERRRWEAQLNDHVDGCGCDGGAIALAVVLGIHVIVRRMLGVRIANGTAGEFAGWTILAVIFAATGKAVARYRSLLIVRKVERQVERAQADHRIAVLVV
jgi:hypothetical protein